MNNYFTMQPVTLQRTVSPQMFDSRGVQLQVGDMIEFDRPAIYNHWGIYVGDGYIVHVTGEPNVRTGMGSIDISAGFSSGVSRNIPAKVLLQALTKVADGNRFYVNNLYDDRKMHFLPRVIAERALARVNEDFDYYLIVNNCEHFVTEMRYGEPVSKQVKDGVENVLIGAAIGMAILAGFAALGSAISRKTDNNKY